MEISNTNERIVSAHSDLAGSSFTDVSLQGSSFEDVNLSGATFHNINLAQTKISDVNLSGVTITNCNMGGMMIEGVAIDDLFKAYEGLPVSPPKRLCSYFTGV